MQRADKNYKDLKQKQKSVIADKTYSMYSYFLYCRLHFRRHTIWCHLGRNGDETMGRFGRK